MDTVAITLHLLFEENTQVILTYIKMSTNFLIAELVLVLYRILKYTICVHIFFCIRPF